MIYSKTSTRHRSQNLRAAKTWPNLRPCLGPPRSPYITPRALRQNPR